MKTTGNFRDAKLKVMADVQLCIGRVQRIAAIAFETPEAGVAILHQLRNETYEDLNQIQHEHLIVRAAEWLIEHSVCPSEADWSWNPRQTGNHLEPDLQGAISGRVVVSAEITTSQNPNGVIDSRMRNTLGKLAKAEGAKYYFVRSDAMCSRALTKIAKAGWPIEVVMLPV